MKDAHALIERLWKKIFDRRPVFGDIIRKHGGRNLFSYAEGFLDVRPSPVLDARKGELIETVRDLIAPRLGTAVAGEVAAQLTRLPLVSTADHHAPINHPFWINANIVSGIPLAVRPDRAPHYLVVLSFSSISVNNASGWPRGIEFHDGSRGALCRIPLLPAKHAMAVVYGMRGYAAHDIEKSLQELAQREDGTHHIGARIAASLKTYFGDAAVKEDPRLVSQLTKINFHLWPRFFHASSSALPPTDVRAHAPSLVYLEIESLTAELLTRHHLQNPRSPLYRLLFDGVFRHAALRHFDNIAGAFSREKKTGTHLFWGINPHLHRTHLDLAADAFIVRETGARIPLTPDRIAAALREKTIFPSMLLCYLTIALYYGMKCLGGFCQVHDLTMIKEAWMRLLRACELPDEADAVAPVQTKELGGDGTVLSYRTDAEGNLAPATGMDMLLSSADTQFDRYVAQAKRVTLAEAMAPMLPEMYTVLYTKDEREETLSSLTTESIVEATGLKEKMTPSSLPHE
ncbi:hypothetical protein A3J43_00235 [Candidatus Uhrbacteria bacterium RIFCSPHIGHO2_12_FULL_54_23]|uniref:Uncharacterized protein n=3 Tax=Candidatus Uhriibacteriota TaxID=1752732 RepID=A0A1F7UFP0_9BACT|nr:MAG: hypothetical protein A3J43_00235 [Candidatus Uhrbacteria bacterium RIFCSPHIGHO2_12_FULL_54_23]OGL85515.1 MAG: hypothetical protein A3B36_00875 [Candidatus Uhrbacteria bacterium RIFCSPLOWO2_01_FULL_55_36]OGL89646.1 MAG: hypothetical protein A3J36_02100 [Candidatus Uhrbacteria bacterium RIFCSPLOWO2_02_FULL_54_37]